MPQDAMQQLQLENIKQVEIIKSVSYNQYEILRWIMDLYCPHGFELDPTYSTGNFYRNGIPQPRFKFDLFPQKLNRDMICANSENLPIKSYSIKSIIFDPPFVVGVGKDGKPGITRTRFGSYRTIFKLWEMYQNSLSEFYRVLKHGCFLVFKCQDTINSGKQRLSHCEIINMARDIGFYAKDLFVLIAKNRVIRQVRQLHARKYHSYFIVFQKI